MPVRESSAPVGSSAKTISGRGTSARATATRCCWPPESWLGQVVQPVAAGRRSSTISSNHASSGSVPASVSGSRMFSRAVSDGIRLYCWKMKPEPVAPQQRQLGLGQLAESSVSPMNADPEVSRSSPATHCISVLLPDPDGPMIAVNRRAGKSTVTPASAWTAASPTP